jgi:hypothetical protein
MSTSTKEHAAQNVVENHDTTDSQGPVSAPVSLEDVERAAALLRPSWEAEPFDDFDAAALASGAAEGAPDGSTKLADTPVEAPPPEAPPPEPAPIDAPPPSQPRKLELVDTSSELDEQGPVDIVAAIPKRTDVQIKDEPSVVLADDEQERKRPTVPPPPRARPSRPSPVVSAAEDGSDPVAQKSRNRRIVFGVLAVAGLLVLAAAVRFAVSGGEDKPTGGVSEARTSATDTSAATAATTTAATTTAPAATLAPATTATETAAPTQTTAPATTPSVATKAEPVATRPSPDTPASAHTKAPPKPTTDTAEPPPATTAAKPPPAPTRTEGPPKPPAGGIVRETPF